MNPVCVSFQIKGLLLGESFMISKTSLVLEGGTFF